MNKSSIAGIVLIILLILVLIFVPVQSSSPMNDDAVKDSRYLDYTEFCNKKGSDFNTLCKDNFEQTKEDGANSETYSSRGTCYELVDQKQDLGRYDLVNQHRTECEYMRTSKCSQNDDDVKGKGRDYGVKQVKIRDPCY